MSGLVSLLTDFGTRDTYIGTESKAIASRAGEYIFVGSNTSTTPNQSCFVQH